jgi:RNA polymerase sigma factor (sigma-70 family)
MPLFPGNDAELHAQFTPTHWSVVLAAREQNSLQASEALERLCQAYWPPLYAYIRRQSYSQEDAQDLTQEFFTRLLEKNWLARLQHQNGKFRSFLLTFLEHFLSDQRDRERAQKRGGGQTFISLDQYQAEERQHFEPSDGLTPDQVFDRRWAQQIMENAIRRLCQEYTDHGKGELFACLKDLSPGKHGSQSYAELGAQFGMSEGAIKSAVHRFHGKYRNILRDEIAQTVERPEDINDEIRHLFRIWGEQGSLLGSDQA